MPPEKQVPRLVVHGQAVSATAIVRSGGDVTFTADNHGPPGVSFENLQHQIGHHVQHPFDMVEVFASWKFDLKMRQGELCISIDHEIGNETHAVITRYRQSKIPGECTDYEYLSKDNTWKPKPKGYGPLPEDAIRLPLFVKEN